MTLRIEKIPTLEANFKKSLIDASGKKFTVVKSTLNNVVSIRPPKQEYYYASPVAKDSICYHFTAGVLTGDISALTTQHVSVPYVVARDGTVYELFNPDFWSYHLGIGSTFSNKERSSRTIGIEISNIGPLKLKDDGILYDAYDKGYCLATDTAAYTKVDFRGYHYFANFTDAQYAAIKDLTLQLTQKYKIAYEFLEPAKRFEFLTSVPKKGIVTHANYRSDKSDLAPNFDFSRVAK